MAAVDAKVRIGGEHKRVVKRLRHAHQAGIGQAHRSVGIFLDEFQRPFKVPVEVKGGHHGAALEKRGQCQSAMGTQQVEGFGQHGLARAPRGREMLRLDDRPFVVTVAAAQQRYQKPGVNEDVSGRNRCS